MTLAEIKRLVRYGENLHVEFKRKAAHPEKVIKEVVAFANTEGGSLLVGVDDDGNIPGLKYADEEQYVLDKALKELCKPHVQYDLEVIPVDHKRSVLHYTIKPSRKKPHYALESCGQKYGKAYFRVADKSIQASWELKEILKRSRRNNPPTLSIGEKEKAVLQALGDESKTLTDLVTLTGIGKRVISAILISFVVTNVLRIIPQEGGDLYILKG